ncbi:MAG: RNA polymerase factor sigma-54 [Pseudomonadota bacterium]
MKQTLALKLGQNLTMTPQLQQAIKLLQLSALDLQAEIQEALESNPLLELSEDHEADGGSDDQLDQEAFSSSDNTLEGDTAGNANTDADVDQQLEAPLGDDLPVDSNWEDTYPTTSSLPAADSDFDPLANKSEAQTLTDHLIWQLNLTPMAASDQVIAMSIIDALDTNGFLTQTTHELWQALLEQQPSDGDDQITEEDVIGVLSRVQEFDPLGVAARDVQECLMLQLNALDPHTDMLDEAKLLIREHLDLLGSKDFNTLRRKTKFSDDTLAACMTLIRTLNPRPGSSIAEEPADYIIPDVVVKKSEGRWVVELNQESTPQVRINPLYETLAKDTPRSEDKTYLRDNLNEARWFLKSLQTRNDTLLRVAAKIVEVQRGFLEYGPEAMKPLILADIAEAVDLHESTISRVTTRKYMSTPRGVYELKFFFSSHVGTSSGGEVSSTAIRALIQKLTAEENPKKPLSDNKIAAILKEQNINVARRTVAKYRESLSIPPSNERKQLV